MYKDLLIVSLLGGHILDSNKNLTKLYPHQEIKALDNVDLSVNRVKYSGLLDLAGR